ncbi:hypothetical protein H0H81_002776 [Sphagnurus paluster]|uniref:non-specific serine/threonine protein kinase n=1 Tax=Sphagnurus paluster TaxID=117069 RepID=A0A9P7K7K8_9AGAR|nr:hypothetical protein H0H81_002776 [Sphagnurus paluster]
MLSKAPETERVWYTQYPSIEYLSAYRPGGYHPVDIGEVYHKRYRVLNKLGHGTFATVWLVKDLKSFPRRFLSLKIAIADAQHVSREIQIIRHLRRYQQENPLAAGGEYVLQVFDDFEIKGPNGTHQCIVSELCGPSIRCEPWMIWNEDDEDKVDELEQPRKVGMVQRLIAQVTRGIAYLHKCGIVHGDLHKGNILLYSSKVAHCQSTKELHQYFGRPNIHPITRFDNKPFVPSPHLPKRLTFPACPEIDGLFISMTDPSWIHIKICDFGESFLSEAPPTTKLGTPLAFCAPEIIFHSITPPGPPTDIWALATLFYMVFTDEETPLFYMCNDEDQILVHMVRTLGKLPDVWWTRWEAREQHFDADGLTYRPGSCNIAPVFYPPSGLDAEIAAELDRIIRMMVRLEMSERITASGLIDVIPENWMGDQVAQCHC